MGSIKGERDSRISKLFLPRLSEYVSLPERARTPDRNLTLQALQAALYSTSQLTLITCTKKTECNRIN